MSIVVGVAPGHGSAGAVRLGALLARSYDRELVVVAVNSVGWPPGYSNVDAEYQRFLEEQAQLVLDEAKRHVPADIPARYLIHGASSARRGLLEVCEAEDAHRLVIGSADVARKGEIALGSVGLGLLQGAGVPVAIAPRGYEVDPAARLTRATAAYSGSDTSAELVLGAARVIAGSGAALRVAAFHTRPRAFVAANVSLRAEDEVLQEWERVIRERADRVLDEVEALSPAPSSVSLVFGSGSDWQAALRAVPWETAEVLLVGSSSLGPIARISLGSHAAKIIRSSPVPVLMVPRRATGEYVAGVV